MKYVIEVDLIDESERCVASGSTAENALENLVNALNADEVDTENCTLVVRDEWA